MIQEKAILWTGDSTVEVKNVLTHVKNKYTKMYVKYIYFMLSILQINFYVLNKNTLQFYF